MAGEDDYKGVNFLYEPEGTELNWDGLKEKPQPAVQQASLSGPAPTYAHHTERQGLAGTQMAATAKLPPGTKAQPQDKPMTHDQLMAKAKAMLDAQAAQSEAQMQNQALAQRDGAGAMLPAWLVKQGY
jgi:hypothetical protein